MEPEKQRLKIKLPREIEEQLKFFCDANGLGLSEIATPEFSIFIMGNVDFHVNHVSLMAAHALLSGVLSGAFVELNEEMKEKQEKEANETIPN